MTLQLQLDVSDDPASPVFVYWNRHIQLKDVLVAPFTGSPRDLYVAYPDWAMPPPTSTDTPTPLASLADMVLRGATVVNNPRTPRPTDKVIDRVAVQRLAPSDMVAGYTSSGGLPTPTPATPDPAALRQAILDRIPVSKRDTAQAKRLVDGLLSRAKVFGEINPADCTHVVDFELIDKDPDAVSFRVPVTRRMAAAGEAALKPLDDWLAASLCERVPWSEPAYGFAIVVPKSNGTWRVVISPINLNNATKSTDPIGGYLPESMLAEALRVGRLHFVWQLDLKDAFATMVLGPQAKRLSTFTTPRGKIRWNHGYFGHKNFPAEFQILIMEKVVLPTLDKHPNTTICAWIDDIVGGAGDFNTLYNSLMTLVDNILAIGGRISLKKCHFLPDTIDWCGVQLDLTTNQWRASPDRVRDLLTTPRPTDRKALAHVLGVLRYYYFQVSDQLPQRERLALLAALDYHGVDLSTAWTPQHDAAFKDALASITRGNWLLVYDPTQPVYLTTDAAGNNGYAITAYQINRRTGLRQEIGYWSKGWIGPQLFYTAQVKEAYAQRSAATQIAPQHFPYADIILLCDNKNWTADAASADKRVARWQREVYDSGARVKIHIPGDWNTITDHGSRAMLPDPAGQLTPEQEYEMHIYGMPLETEEGVAETPTTVPGHLPMAALTKDIAEAQLAAPAAERALWTGKHYSAVILGGHNLTLLKQKLLVPSGATELKQKLLHLAHDVQAHYTGVGRTIHNLQQQARVTWHNIYADVAAYIGSCFRCSFAKPASHSPAIAGTLTPTTPPHVHHTWYVDLKGPLPHGTGYILSCVEAVTRYTRLRYLPVATVQQCTEELLEIIHCNGTRPHVIRADRGSTFHSDIFRDWCASQGITYVPGVAHHSQGQGLVETRFRGIAASLMATLGHKAPLQWCDPPHLGNLEGIINNTYVEAIGGSPSWAMFGREPRTQLSALTDWTTPDYGTAIGCPAVDHNGLSNILADHHSAINAAQGRAMLASSLAQGITKRAHDNHAFVYTYTHGEWFLVHRAAANRLLPHFYGPFKATDISPDGNFVSGTHFADAGSPQGPFHVSRLIPFDMSRATPAEIAHHQLEPGTGLVDTITNHRTLADGTMEFEVKWFATDLISWLSGADLKSVIKAIDYCKERGLPAPGSIKPTRPAAPPQGATRARSPRARAAQPHTPPAT